MFTVVFLLSCYKKTCQIIDKSYLRRSYRKHYFRTSFFTKVATKRILLDTSSSCQGQLMYSDTTGKGTSVFNCAEVQVFSDSLKIVVEDFGKEDDDSVSIQLNNIVLARRIRLENTPMQLKNKKKWGYYLFKSKPNFLYYFAHNEGSIPPNTAFIYIDDGIKKQAIAIGAKAGTYGRLIINYKKQ